jgi:hypothetical protein
MNRITDKSLEKDALMHSARLNCQAEWRLSVAQEPIYHENL